VGDWRWLTRYDPRRASGRELILRGLAAEGGGVLVVVVLLAVVGPVVRAATDGWPWWPTRAAVDLGVLLGLLAAGAAVERAARRRLRRRSPAV
jgi:threonine/homoserine/homoserine lactone efflux protein